MTNTGFYPKVDSRVFPVMRVPVAGVKPLVVVANKLSSGTAIIDSLVQNITEENVDALFGINSNLARAIKTGFSVDKKRVINAVALIDDVTGTQATATITFTGTIDKTTQAVVKCGNDVFSVGVDTTMTLDGIASDLSTKITNAKNKRFTSSVTGAVLTLTALHKGTCGNSISLEVYFLDSTSQRITEITATNTGFSGGTTVSSITNALSILNDLDVEFAFDTSLLIDATNLAGLKAFLAARLNSSNAVRNGFCFAHYINSLSGLQGIFGSSAFGDCPLFVASCSKSVSTVSKKGSENGNYPLDVAVAVSCVNSAIVTPGADVSSIMSHKPLGSITNQGVARGGMILPGLSVSNNSYEAWSSSEIGQLEAIFLNAICTRDGVLQCGEMFTLSTTENYQSFPEMSIVTRIQADLFLLMKQYKNQIINDKILAVIRGGVLLYLQKVSSITHNWLSDNAKDIKAMMNSVVVARDSVSPYTVNISMTVKTVNSLREIRVNTFVNTLNLD